MPTPVRASGGIAEVGKDFATDSACPVWFFERRGLRRRPPPKKSGRMGPI
jgi:hypothetical protein